MPRNANFILEVSIRIPEAFTLDTITRSPRAFKPKDLRTACGNNEVTPKTPAVPESVAAFASYVVTDYFALLHATGLYNRQRGLWEALSKVSAIEIQQRQRGLIHKEPVPIFDLAFNDYKKKALLRAIFVDRLPAGFKLNPVALLKQLAGRARGNLSGILLCFYGDFPSAVVDYVVERSESAHPIGRYESTLAGTSCPCDLILMTGAATGAGDGVSAAAAPVFRLIYPDLKRKQPLPSIQSTAVGRSAADQEEGPWRD